MAKYNLRRSCTKQWTSRSYIQYLLLRYSRRFPWMLNTFQSRVSSWGIIITPPPPSRETTGSAGIFFNPNPTVLLMLGTKSGLKNSQKRARERKKKEAANTDKICIVVLRFALLTDKGTDCAPVTAPFWNFGSQPRSLQTEGWGVMQSGLACFPL